MVKSLVLGFFDGVHKAHRAVINSALDISDDVTLITFKNSPAEYFCGSAEYILPRSGSVERILSLGVNNVIELDFPKIADMSAEDYLNYLINTFSPNCIFTGFNHTFGVNKSGNSDFLTINSSHYNYQYVSVPPVLDEGNIISSSLIKDYLKNGDIIKANYLLEDKFYIEGTVVHGAEIGRKIGFPTANIKYPQNIVKLPFGAYCVQVKIQNQIMRGMMNWGLKPTVHNVIEPITEVHIFDFDGDLYDKFLRIDIIKHIRDELKFNSLDELKQQIQKDKTICLKL